MEATIWTEKYRPKNFSDVKGQEHIVKRVKAFIDSKNMPHLMFSGPAGTGKSSMSLVIARQLFSENYKSNFLELNASDERGIDVVRVKVKDFARTRALGDVPFKIIFLDESDALTKEAQQALRRTMENYTRTCRFILSCNYSSKIIDPIQSRCAIFKFRPLSEQDVYTIIENIKSNEGLIMDDNAKKALYILSGGDCRRVENILQSCAVIDKNVTEEMLYSLASAAKPEEIKRILALAINGKFLESRKQLLDAMLNFGLSGLDIIKKVHVEHPETPIIAMTGFSSNSQVVVNAVASGATAILNKPFKGMDHLRAFFLSNLPENRTSDHQSH